MNLSEIEGVVDFDDLTLEASGGQTVYSMAKILLLMNNELICNVLVHFRGNRCSFIFYLFCP